MIILDSATRKRLYLALGIVNALLAVLVQLHLPHMTPTLAYGVLAVSAFLTSFMHSWTTPDEDPVSALEKTVVGFQMPPKEEEKK